MIDEAKVLKARSIGVSLNVETFLDDHGGLIVGYRK